MICPGCEGKNRDGARFCTFCGENLALRCSVCDAELIPEARFCDACGAAVGADLESATPAVAARKVVTVLFADLTGSTALEERMDAESVRSILDRFYAAMRVEVERHGGRVVKFTGDGVMAAFGVPEVHEDDAARAVDAALAMRNELEQLASDLSLDLSLKVGINTGEVVVSASDDDVVGDAVNIASRLEGAATAGEVLVGEDTWRLTRSTSRYESVPPLTLKGKSEPVPAYLLLAVDERTAEAATAPFVGRDAELRRLLQVFEDCVEANAARLVTIVGSPGLGKTRLARELMAELREKATVQETRCDPAGSATFAPIAEALRNATGITETSTEDEIVAVLAAALPEDDPDRDKIANRAAAVLGAGQPGSTEETFWALRRLIEAAARNQPVVVVLDDMHWAEPLLLDFVEHITEWIRDAPVLFVGTGRPELRDIRPSLVEGGRAAAVISLEGLNQDATTQLALNLLGAEDLPGELLAKIPASTEGNPLFVRELVRMLVDDGVLLRTAEGWTVTVDVEAIQVPPTIQSLLSARVDRLRGDERAVMELASVVGKEFYRGALVDLAPANVRDLVDGVLESLRRKELVEPVGTYWIDEPVFRFHHVLIRDAAYRRLLKESRADLHERVAEWLEVKTAHVLGEHDELIGYHLEQAHEYKKQLGRPDVDVGGRAAALLGTAARRALDGDDLPAAAALSGRALNCLPEDDEGRADLLIVRCEALLSIGDVSAGTIAIAQLESVADTPRLTAWATCFAGQLANLTSSERLHETEERVAAAAAELSELGDQAGAAKANTVRAAALAALGRFADCEDVLDEAKNAAQAAKDNRLITATLGALPHVALWGPSPVSRAGGRCLDTIRLLRITTGSAAVEEMSRRCQAVLEALRGRDDAARGMLRRARRTLMELGLEHELLETELLAGIVELVSGDPAAAIEHLRSAHDGFRKTGVDVRAAQSAALLARAHLAIGEDEEAESFVGTSEHLGAQDLKTAIAWRSVRAELLARRGEFDDARRLAGEAVELASRTDALVDQGDAYRSLSAVLAAAGDMSGARAANERASEMYERKGATALVVLDVTAVPKAHPPIDRPVERTETSESLTNATTRLVDRWNAAFNARDFDEVARCCATGIVYEHRRPLFRQSGIGIENQVAVMQQVADELNANVEADAVAIRGETLCLVRQRFFPQDPSRGGFEYDLLLVIESDSEGLLAANVYFESDDLDAAFAELDQRFVAQEGAAYAAEIATTSAFYRAMNFRNWGELESLFTEDLVQIDHRPAWLGEMDRERLIESFRALASIYPFRSDVLRYHALAEGRALVHWLAHGLTDEGALIQNPFALIIGFRGNHIHQLEPFPIDALDAARARFEELVKPSPTLSNLATVANARIAERIVRRDWESLAGCLGEGSVVEDRRAGMRADFVGPEAQIENFKIITDVVDLQNIETQTLAIRGEHLALSRLLFIAGEAEDRVEVELLSLNEVDSRAQVVATWSFDSADIETALRMLDERYLEALDERRADVWRLEMEAADALNKRNKDRFASLLASDVVLVDRRPASFGELNRAEFLDATWAKTEMAPDTRWTASAVRAIEPGGVLYAMVSSGTTEDGVHVEVAVEHLVLMRDGLVTRMERYAPEDLPEALARFEELVRKPSPELTNASVIEFERELAATEAEDWDELKRLVAADVLIQDRRPGMSFEYASQEAVVKAAIAMNSVSAHVLSLDVVATRGDRLSLMRMRIGGADAERRFESEVLSVNEVDEAGRVLYRSVFEPTDLDVAFADLDERFIAGEGAASEEILRLGLRLISAFNSRDWEATSTLFAEDITIRDHRRTGLGEIGADPWMLGNQDLIRLAGSLRTELIREIALAPAVALVEILSTGTSEEGVAFELPTLGLVSCRGGRVTRIELFEVDQRDQALALFEEAREMSPLRLDNACTRMFERWRYYFESQDWEALVALHVPDCTIESRQKVTGTKGRGRSHIESNLRAMSSVGVRRVPFTPIAIRGDRLALVRWEFHGEPGTDFSTEALLVGEVDAEGRQIAAVAFDLDDIDAAFLELDERYASGEGARYADIVRFTSNSSRLVNAHDWDNYRRTIAEDAVFVSHQQFSLPETYGVEETVATVRALSDMLVAQRLFVVRDLALAEDRGLGEVLTLGTTPEGVDVEFNYLALLQIRNNQAVRVETFALDDADSALARFEELGREKPVSRPLENAASRVERAGGLATLEGRWDELAYFLAEDGVLQYGLKVLQFTANGRDEWVKFCKSIYRHERPTRTEYSVLATRGERLALGRRVMGGDPGVGYEIEVVLITELNAEGKVSSVHVFEPEELDAAFAELDERFLAAEGAPYAEILQLSDKQRIATAAGDWDAYRALVSDDLVLVDHRPAGLGEIRGAESVIEASRGLTGLIRDVRMTVPAIHELSEHCILVEVRGSGTAEHGGRVEMTNLRLQQIRDGLVIRMELFPLEAIEDARTRFAELARSSPAPTGLENDATSATARFIEAFVRRDWFTLVDLCADDLVREDRRNVIGGTFGKEKFVEAWKAQAEFGFETIGTETLGTRAERLSLQRFVLGGSHDFEIEVLVVVETNDEGRIVHLTYFDTDDLDASFAELDARYVAGDAREYSEIVRLSMESLRALNASDWSALRGLLADDIELFDHRPMSKGRMRGPDEWIDLMKALRELVTAATNRIICFRALAPGLAVVDIRAEGVTADGGVVDTAFMSVFQVRSGRVSKIEWFSTDKPEIALGRFEELAHADAQRPGVSHVVLENAATRSMDEMSQFANAGDVTGQAASMAEHFELINRRTVTGGPGILGPDANVEDWRNVASLGAHIGSRLLATRGERLALFMMRLALRDKDADERFNADFEFPVITEVNEEGLAIRSVIFEADDIDAAFEELDDRWLASAEATGMDRTDVGFFRAYNSGDWETVRTFFTDDFRFVDRRPAAFGSGGVDEFVTRGRFLREMTTELRTRLLASFSVGESCLVVYWHRQGIDEDGNTVSWEHVDAVAASDGKITAMEHFDPAQFNEAMARAEELTRKI